MNIKSPIIHRTRQITGIIQTITTFLSESYGKDSEDHSKTKIYTTFPMIQKLKTLSTISLSLGLDPSPVQSEWYFLLFFEIFNGYDSAYNGITPFLWLLNRILCAVFDKCTPCILMYTMYRCIRFKLEIVLKYVTAFITMSYFFPFSGEQLLARTRTILSCLLWNSTGSGL